MNWETYDNWIVITAALSAIPCALLGNFLLLRGMSMMGDAITHAVLPGIGSAFLIILTAQQAPWVAEHLPWARSLFMHVDPRGPLPMLLGAVLAGVATTLFTQWIQHLGRVDHGAAMGVVFTTLFAIGLILIVQTADDVDLDPGCVLYGAVELSPLDDVKVWWTEATYVPRSVPVLGAVLLLDALFVTLFFKELKITSFDPALATTLGINATVMHYALMILVAITTVASFEVVGSILVIAMLIVPPAAAYLMTDRLGPMLFISLIFAALTALLGHVSAITLPGLLFEQVEDTRTAGMMAVAAGVMFTMTLLLAPHHGLLIRSLQHLRLSLRIAREDILGLLYRLEEEHGHGHPVDAGVIALHLSVRRRIHRFALNQLLRRGRLKLGSEGYVLTDDGRSRAAHLIRSHRLWETFLHERAGLKPDHVHGTAEQMEHLTDTAMAAQLAEAVGQDRRDPHGRKIPDGQTG